MIINVSGTRLEFRSPDSMLQRLADHEVAEYRFDEVNLAPGDVVVDVGAHRGAVALYLAEQFGARVYAYEPEPENYAELTWAIDANDLGDLVTPHNLAVTADGRDLTIFYGGHSGEAGAFHSPHPSRYFQASSTTVSAIFRTHRIGTCRLLKLDCEGAEHEIITGMGRSLLDRVDHIRGELHMNHVLHAAGHSNDRTAGLTPQAQWQVCPNPIEL